MSTKQDRSREDEIQDLLDSAAVGGYEEMGSEDSPKLKQPAPLKKPGLDSPGAQNKANTNALLLSFVLMVVVGLGNKIFQVLQLIPMYNYPLFVNLLTTFVYMPLSFAYILPMMRWGTLITKEATEIPKYKFAVMGLLDSLAGIMQTLSVNFLANGSLVILLSQAAIPVSMVISRWLLKTKYRTSQFVGAAIVAVGLVIVLLPSFLHSSDKTGSHPVLWAMVMILSCVPMCLSSVYKEKALGEVEIDAVYLNGWVAVFQFLAAIPLLFPSAPAAGVPIGDLKHNMLSGLKCLVGHNTYHQKHGSIHVDDCKMSPVYVSVYLLFNINYNILIILILKYGSANILWLAMTIMVPLGNVAFALKFVPNHKPLEATDIIGLLLIMTGLITYRFWAKLYKRWQRRKVAGQPLLQQNVAPDSPFLTSKSSPGGVSTPVRGISAHVVRKQRAAQSRQERWEAERMQRGHSALGSTRSPASQNGYNGPMEPNSEDYY